MDLQKIGAFIKEQRKEKNLTQAQLGEKLKVSEKAISKWECGNGFPDAGLLLSLCEVLGVSANELLSGQKLNKIEYKEQAESNLVDMQSALEKSTKFALTLEIVLGYMTSITFFILIFVSSFVEMADWLRIVLIVVGLIHFMIGVGFCILIEKDAGFYECKHCHNKHIPTYRQVLWSMHVNRTRYMKCPKCGKKSWQHKVIK
ncbi:MAG: helix-turn-helix domain-containing protein [Clostridia bacterium]|nr:helix-turn-helix domain-containing protein [Clostridia bacterium]